MGPQPNQQTIVVTATCRDDQEAQAMVKKHGRMLGVVTAKAVGNVVTFVCRVAKDFALITYGRIKDVFPMYCAVTCRRLAD